MSSDGSAKIIGWGPIPVPGERERRKKAHERADAHTELVETALAAATKRSERHAAEEKVRQAALRVSEFLHGGGEGDSAASTEGESGSRPKLALEPGPLQSWAEAGRLIDLELSPLEEGARLYARSWHQLPIEVEVGLSGELGASEGRTEAAHIIWLTETCLSNAVRLETYIQQADSEGDDELAKWFRQAQGECRKLAQQGQRLLRARAQR